MERLGGHPRVVAAGIFATAHRIPLGQRFYWPLFAAAERAGMPLHVHPSTTSVIANAASLPTGMATNYLQSHTCLPQFYMSDLVSLVLEGVFERFPGLRVILVEGGVSWPAARDVGAWTRSTRRCATRRRSCAGCPAPTCATTCA